MKKEQATKTLVLLILMLLLFLTSCAKDMLVGDYYKHENTEQLTKDMTEQEVISILGTEPSDRTVMGNGNYFLQWQYFHNSLSKSAHRHVAILFSSDNKMIKIAGITKSGKEF